MPNTTRAFQTLAILALAAGCSSNKAGPPSPYATPDGFCTKWAQAACNKTVVADCGADSADVCVTAQQSFCLGLVQSGYAPKYGPDCVSAVKAAYADAKLTKTEYELVRRLGGVCATVLSGPGGQDASCSSNADCDTLSGLSCVIAPGGAGSCQTPELVSGGNTCGQPQQVCDTGFYCNGSNCIADAAQGASCGADVPCADGLGCEGTAGSETCQSLGAVGSACASDAECASNICAIASGASSGVCEDTVILSQIDPVCASLR